MKYLLYHMYLHFVELLSAYHYDEEGSSYFRTLYIYLHALANFFVLIIIQLRLRRTHLAPFFVALKGDSNPLIENCLEILIKCEPTNSRASYL
jgi:hypothetical protein